MVLVFLSIKDRAVYGTHKRTPCSQKSVARFQLSLLHCQLQEQSKFTAALRGGGGGEHACVQLHSPTPGIVGRTCKGRSWFSQDLRNCLPWFTYKVIDTIGNKQAMKQKMFAQWPYSRAVVTATFAPAAPLEQKHSQSAHVC